MIGGSFVCKNSIPFAICFAIESFTFIVTLCSLSCKKSNNVALNSIKKLPHYKINLLCSTHFDIQRYLSMLLGLDGGEFLLMS